jgi:hypothetical protein
LHLLRAARWLKHIANGQEMLPPHALLGVESNADEAAINAAFRQAAKKYHPDLRGGDDAGVGDLRLLIAARDRLLRQHRKQLIENRASKTDARTEARKLAAFAAVALLFVSLILFDVFRSGGGKMEAEVPSPAPPSSSIQLAETGDADEAAFRLIRDLQENDGGGGEGGISRKRSETHRHARRFHDGWRRAADGAVSLVKDLRYRASNR